MTSSTKKQKVDLQYRKGWPTILYCSDNEPKPHDEWGQFYKQWWGPLSSGKEALVAAAKAAKLSEKRVIQVGSDWIWTGLSLLDDSDGSIIVRDEYRAMYDRIRDLFASRKSGVIVTGQPGIGKSYFAIYALLRCMTDGKTVLFTTSASNSYLFDESGIRRKKKYNVELEDLPRHTYAVPTWRVWSLIDTDPIKGPEMSELVSPSLFVVLTAAPVEEKYKHWRKQKGALWWVMNPWSEEELHLLMKEQRNRHKSSYGVEELIENVGPCPGDILEYIENPKDFDRRVEDAVTRVSVETMISFFRNIHSPHSSDATGDSLSHKIVIFWRSPYIFKNGDDTYFVAFKSWKIRTMVQAHFSVLSLQQASHLFDASRSLSKGSALAGFAFEALANAYISGKNQDNNIKVFWDFAPMVPVKPIKGYHYRFQHSSGQGGGGTRKSDITSVSNLRPS